MTGIVSWTEEYPVGAERKNMVCLADLKPGESAVIDQLEKGNELHRRLLDLGFLSGTKIKCILRSPLGDPTAYLLHGTVIALRREDSELVLIQGRNGE